MSSEQDVQEPISEVSDQQVLAYLKEHSDFLVRHPELLDTVAIPDQQSGVTSLIEHQVSVLQDKNRRLTGQLREYHAVAESNHGLLEKLHDLYLIMLQATSATELLDKTISAIDQEFNCDVVAIGLYLDHPEFTHPSCISLVDGNAAKQFEPLSRQSEPICGRLKKSRLQILFAEQAEQIRSAALAPLSEHKAIGFLALGSKDEHKYHPGMGTLFLSLLGQMLGHCLEAWLSPQTEQPDG
jgi:uncharacterized protein YigA (DUF484 family)